MGEPEFAEGVWCGIELDRPDGKNNGSKHGIRYFTCDQNHGVFVLLSKVELDPSRRSRSRPNSAPSSRTPSVDRVSKKTKTLTTGVGGGKPQMSSYSLQQELVNRLSTPTLQKRKPTQQQSSSGKGPMKAFATRGVEAPAAQQSGKKANLAPFRSGGMQKAVSSENLRSLKEKEKAQSGGMTGKKSSSQKDLRSSGTASKGAPLSSAGKTRRKTTRANSYSELFDNEGSSNGGISVGNNSKRRSLEVTSLNDTQVYNWPRTSTPGNRYEQKPDGCSSPEGAELSDSHSTTSSMGDTNSSCSDKMAADTPATQERGFIATPNDSSTTAAIPGNGSVVLDSPPTGLVTQTSEFVKSERKTPSIEMCRVALPDGSSTHPKQVYKNRPSGSATLPHPLTLQTAETTPLTNGNAENSVENSSILSPNSFRKHFLDSNGSVSLT